MRDIPKIIPHKCIKNFSELLIHTCVMEELGVYYLCVHGGAAAELVERGHLVRVEPKAGLHILRPEGLRLLIHLLFMCTSSSCAPPPCTCSLTSSLEIEGTPSDWCVDLDEDELKLILARSLLAAPLNSFFIPKRGKQQHHFAKEMLA
jgi:hypothetical protein